MGPYETSKYDWIMGVTTFVPIVAFIIASLITSIFVENNEVSFSFILLAFCSFPAGTMIGGIIAGLLEYRDEKKAQKNI